MAANPRGVLCGARPPWDAIRRRCVSLIAANPRGPRWNDLPPSEAIWRWSLELMAAKPRRVLDPAFSSKRRRLRGMVLCAGVAKSRLLRLER